MGKKRVAKNSEPIPNKKIHSELNENLESMDDSDSQSNMTKGESYESLESLQNDFGGFINPLSEERIEKEINPIKTEKYERNDKGPFVVIIEKKNINSFIIGREMKKNNYENIINISQISKNKIRVENKYWYECNKMIEDIRLKNEGFLISIPQMYLYTYGIARGIPLDFDNKEIEENLDKNTQVVEFQRLTKYDENKKERIPSENIKFKFRGSLPNMIKIFNISLKIQFFIPNPIFCRNCLNYGHTAKYCKGKSRCTKCAQELKETNDHESCNKKNCKFCGDGHETNNKNCTERNRQKIIKTIMTKEKKTYNEIKDLLKLKPNKLDDYTQFPNLIQKNNNTNNETIKIMNENKRLLEEINNINIKLNKIKGILSNITHGQPGDNDVAITEIINLFN